jgi:hypothetical protein
MLTLALAVLLTFTDPPADLGNGTVRQPTAAVGRPNGALDVTQFELYDTEAVTFSLTFTSLANPFKLRYGFSFPVIEIYIDDQSGAGSAVLLPGSGMRLPTGATWTYAFKLTGDTLQVFAANANGWQDVTSRYPTTLTVQGTSIIVSSSLPRPEDPELYGLVGSYTGFNETGWTPLSRNESPWAYSSPSQIPAALDIIAPTFEAQQNALASGVLPVIRPPRPTNPWIFVMIGGVTLAVLGVMLRFAPNRKRASAPAYTPTPITPNIQEKRAHPGPYQPEPLKSRSTTLKQRVGGTPPTSEETAAPEESTTPGQLMAAERARAMILGDRKLRDTGETLIANVENTEPIRLDDMSLDNLSLDNVPLDDAQLDNVPLDNMQLDDVQLHNPNLAARQLKTNDEPTVTSEVGLQEFPLSKKSLESLPPRLHSLASTPNLVTPNVPVTPAKPAPQFAASEVWHDEEDEFAFLWNDGDDGEDPRPKKNSEAKS